MEMSKNRGLQGWIWKSAIKNQNQFLQFYRDYSQICPKFFSKNQQPAIAKIWGIFGIFGKHMFCHCTSIVQGCTQVPVLFLIQENKAKTCWRVTMVQCRNYECFFINYFAFSEIVSPHCVIRCDDARRQQLGSRQLTN